MPGVMGAIATQQTSSAMTALAATTTVPATDRPRVAAAGAFVLGLATILGALGSQFIGRLEPCELCYTQRLPYYIGLPLLAVLLIGWNRLPRAALVGGLVVVAAIFVWSTYLGGYHAGVEYGWFPGPTSCTGVGGGLSFDQLNNINAARVIPCDQVQFELFGISLAGFNALISAAIVAVLGWAALTKARA